MFTSIRLGNFKGYANSGDIPLRPLTILVGPNNAGKSTLLQALLLLKQTLEDKASRDVLITSGPLLQMGSFNDIVRGGRTKRARSLSIALTLSDEQVDTLSLFQMGGGAAYAPARSIDVTFAFDRRAKRVKVKAARLWNEKGTIMEVTGGGRKWVAPGLPAAAAKYTRLEFMNFLPVLTPGPRPRRAETAHKIMNFGLTTQLRAKGWARIFEGLRHIAPLRVRLPWYEVPGTMASSELGPGGENLLRVLGSSERYGEGRETLLELVREWLRKFGMVKDINLVNVDEAGTIRSLVAGEMPGLQNINVAAMGEGLSQMMPTMAGVLMSAPSECLLIEQPEVHLHPAAQADLGDLFVDKIVMGQNAQLIVETHSEHLLLRIRRRVADGTISPDQVAILYVEKIQGQSRVRHLELKENGHFDEWPEGFFEEGYKEALLLAEAGAKHQDNTAK